MRIRPFFSSMVPNLFLRFQARCRERTSHRALRRCLGLQGSRRFLLVWRGCGKPSGRHAVFHAFNVSRILKRCGSSAGKISRCRTLVGVDNFRHQVFSPRSDCATQVNQEASAVGTYQTRTVWLRAKFNGPISPTIPVQFGRSAHQFRLQGGRFKLHLRNAPLRIQQTSPFVHQRASLVPRRFHLSSMSLPSISCCLSARSAFTFAHNSRGEVIFYADSRNAVLNRLSTLKTDFRKRLESFVSSAGTRSTIRTAYHIPDRGDRLFV